MSESVVFFTCLCRYLWSLSVGMQCSGNAEQSIHAGCARCSAVDRDGAEVVVEIEEMALEEAAHV